MHSDTWMPHATPPSLIDQKKKHDCPHGPLTQEIVARDLVLVKFRDRISTYKREEVEFGNTLFRNLGGGKFEETSTRADVETLWPWGVAAGDFDADGFVDMYVPSGMGYPY